MLRRALAVGAGLAIFQQVTGSNTIIYYADEIFAGAGFTTAGEQAKARLYAVGLVTQFFLSVVDAIGESTTFFLFAAMCGVTYVFVWFLVPETKVGRSRRSRSTGRARPVARRGSAVAQPPLLSDYPSLPAGVREHV
jgi:hypothetical protein